MLRWAARAHPPHQGSSSIGRAPVSKTGGWGFESLLPCGDPGRDVAKEDREPRDQANVAAPGPGRPRWHPRAPQQQQRPAPQPARQPPRRPVSSSHEVRGELRKVAWPTRPEVIRYTIVVLFTVVLLDALIFGLDYAFAKAVLFLFDT